MNAVHYEYVLKCSGIFVCIYADDDDVRYQEWLEKNRVQHACSDSEDDQQQTQNHHKRFGRFLPLSYSCASDRVKQFSTIVEGNILTQVTHA